ncbi:hypothetical protein BXZ70DRAFT_737996 [Cristinia sonorae]|uniref:FAD-binding PCMH-type domain-containing protein n=1 Tax=Cristinia sonorae TaxID=1940300 RepID=A0A8K0USX9_9AGAR|nr:hypothetical protein BXZ70DRAFT_737996 [Cristinia sonorae]
MQIPLHSLLPPLWRPMYRLWPILRSNFRHGVKKPTGSIPWLSQAQTRLFRTIAHASKGSSGLRGFALGIGSSVAMFAAVACKRADPAILRLFWDLGDAEFASEQLDLAISELCSLLPGAAVVTEKALLETYHLHGYIAIVRARSTEDVVKVVNLANAHRIPLVTRYGSEEPVSDAVSGAVLVDMSGMNKILYVHDEDGDAVCQAAASLGDIERRLMEEGVPLALPLEAGQDAAIATVIGNGTSGTGEWVLNTAVLPNGQVVKTQRRAQKSASGFDTTKLFVGTEGTMGIITEVTIRLAPVVPFRIGVLQFDDITSAISAAIEISTNWGVNSQWIKILDDNAVSTFNTTQVTQQSQYLPIRNSVLIKIEGSGPALSNTAASMKKLLRNYKHSQPSFFIPDPVTRG